MEKPRNPIAAALLLGAGLFLYSPGGHRSQPLTDKVQVPSKAGTSTAAMAGGETDHDGPWKASCNYWNALRPERTGADEPVVPSHKWLGSADVDADVKTLVFHVVETRRAASECSGATGDSWGVPDNMRSRLQHGLQAHAVVATVPDPIHSHLAPEFDRALDALIEAASDNGYLASYSWLPWTPKAQEDSAAKSVASGADEPGLLIFDKRSKTGETPNVLYMFLVAEMPGDGLNVGQLKKALTYELQLRSKLGDGFPTDREGRLRVIGPQYSGSAMSLIQTLNTVLFDPRLNTEPGRVKRTHMVGTTQTEPARRILNRCETNESVPCPPRRDVEYDSLASGEAIAGLMTFLGESGYDLSRALNLREDGTFFGAGKTSLLTVAFPRDISLLRNSHKDEQNGSASSEASPPTPYLRLTTRDEGSQDTLPEFSTDVTPLSQEAQLMSIAHALSLLHADFAYIAASNPMDTLFLAKFLHRSNPDTRLVMDPDLLLQREGDDEAYIGSLSVTPYPLIWAGRSPEMPGRLRTFASAQMQAFYNAASLTLGLVVPLRPSHASDHGEPILFGYSGPSAGNGQDGETRPGLWLTVVGSDGYYPVAMLAADSGLPQEPQKKYEGVIRVYPSHAWQGLCVLVWLGCLLHIVALCSANYASPQTGDLDIQENCMRHRRVLYGQVGGTALFLMSIVLAVPAMAFLRQHSRLRLDPADLFLAALLLLFGLGAGGLAFSRTFRVVTWDAAAAKSLFKLSEKRLCAVLYWAAIAAALVLMALWFTLCMRSGAANLGIFFCYRCLHPLSGTSPIAPALLLLWGWFFWALMHARRLRLTLRSRPILPDTAALQSEPCASYSTTRPDLFVSDDQIRKGLLEDTTCLMISRRVLQQAFRAERAPHAKLFDSVLMICLTVMAVAWIGLCPMHALDHLGMRLGPTSLYELFVGLLLVPLLVIAMCAAARLFLMAASLRAHLLEPLERMPLRQAFSRLQGFNWVSMLRESGQLERWRDMARSSEGIRQLLNHPELPLACHSGALDGLRQTLEAQIAMAQRHVRALREGSTPPDPSRRACDYMEEIEKKFASCAENILCCILLPHWLRKRHDLMQSVTEPPSTAAEPEVVLLAEEFLAIRYVAFIRAILAQMRYLLVFITAAVVLVMLAVNSYPFQPKQEIDWWITGLFLLFSVGIVLMFAQMHRNSLLSRITDTKAHELGFDFYVRVVTFGALPLITWLATQYPSIGSTLYGVLKPGLDVMK